MNTFLYVLLAVDAVLAVSLILFVVIRSHRKFYKTEKESFDPLPSIEVDALKKDQTPLIIGDLDNAFFKTDKR